MRFKKAVKKTKKLDCPEALAAALKPSSRPPMEENVKAGVACKHKARSGKPNIFCYIMDGSDCPLGKK